MRMPSQYDQYGEVYFVESNGEIQFKPGTPLYAKYRKHGGKLSEGIVMSLNTLQISCVMSLNIGATLQPRRPAIPGGCLHRQETDFDRASQAKIVRR